MNFPARVFAQLCVNPRKLKLPGLPSPRLCRSRSANRPTFLDESHDAPVRYTVLDEPDQPSVNEGVEKAPDVGVEVGIELGRAYDRWRVTNLALSIARWDHSSTMVTFPEAPLRSRTVGFPESGSDLGTSPQAFPPVERFKRWHACAPITDGLFVPYPHDGESALSRLCVRAPLASRGCQVSSAPLPAAGVTGSGTMSRIASKSVTSSSSLLWAHAPEPGDGARVVEGLERSRAPLQERVEAHSRVRMQVAVIDVVARIGPALGARRSG